MNTKTAALCRVLLLVAASAAFGIAGASHACAQANLTFSGGNGTPLVLTLSAPVTYTVTTAPTTYNPYFDLQNVGNVGNSIVLGTITYTVNGGAARTFSTLDSGATYGGSESPSDALLEPPFMALSVGDVVRLNAGTLTTQSNVASAPPANGAYQTFIIDVAGTKLDAMNGVAVVPEPSTEALVILGGAGLLGLILRRCWAIGA